MNKLAILSLSSDLKRICLSIQRNSPASIERFNKEAQKWLEKSKNEENYSLLQILNKVDATLKAKDDLKKAEDCLMYSVLLQNRAIM